MQTPHDTRSGNRQAKATAIRIAIVDDHPILREGLAQLVNNEPDLVVCATATNVDDAMRTIASTDPDVAIIDLSLGGRNGLELVKYLSTSQSRVRMLVLSMHDELLFAERALLSGAHGYIMKQGAMRDVLDAIRKVASGLTYVSPAVAARLVANVKRRDATAERLSPVERLTNRERQVFELIGNGLATSHIARQLKLSIKTVETHQAHIKEKLGLKNANELLRSATSWAQSI